LPSAPGPRRAARIVAETRADRKSAEVNLIGATILQLPAGGKKSGLRVYAASTCSSPTNGDSSSSANGTNVEHAEPLVVVGDDLRRRSEPATRQAAAEDGETLARHPNERLQLPRKQG